MYVVVLATFFPWIVNNSQAGEHELVGTWNFTWEETCLPTGYEKSTEPDLMVITNQNGNTFEGYFFNPDDDDNFFTGVINNKDVRITDADYDNGVLMDVGILTGKYKSLGKIEGTYSFWDVIDDEPVTCTGVFKFIKVKE